MINSKKEEIIKWLKELKRIPTSRFCGLIGLDINYIKKYLEELEKENIIKREEETNATYWILNEVNNE